MKRNNTYKWLFVIFIVAWALRELYPPSSTPLLQEFEARAVGKDTNFTAIVARAQALGKTAPERTFGNLLDAIGTNDVQKYFPNFKASGEHTLARSVLDRLQRDSAGQIKLGLDLRGGTEFRVEMETNRFSSLKDSKEVLDKAVEVLRKRVDRLGVAEPVIQPSGDRSILIALPGLSDVENEAARSSIQKAAFLEFRMVHPDSDEYIKQGIPVPGYEVLKEKQRKDKVGQPANEYLVKIAPERGLTGKNVKSANVARQSFSNEPEIHFTLDSEGAEKFAALTKEYSPQGNKYFLLAIVLDKELCSAPRINGVIPGGSGTITGNFDYREASDLATALENPLEAPVHIVEERRVDPSLGKDSIRSGLMASIIGVIAVAIFMLVYYMFAGLVANAALILNVIVLLGVMCSIDTTLTIPGIAGIVLTIGMAVDANVLIYERIREELATGKSIRGALAAGYDKAFGTIFDSNLTTLISSVILIYMGTGSVKGFGVSLTIGLMVSMFTSLVVTRIIFDWLLDKGLLSGIPMLHLIRNNNLDFMKLAKPAFVASWALIIVGVIWGGVRGKDVMGVDFAGGDNVTLSFEAGKKVENDKVRDALSKAAINDAMIQYQRDIVKGIENLRLTVAFKTGDKAIEVLNKAFPESKFKKLALQNVGPTVGVEIMKAAIISVLLSLFGILIYVAMRYEFSFAIGAVIAIIHDILMTTGCFFISGRQLSATMVAAILTIIGFSINDTIVIFDRIREDLKLGIKGSFTEIMNKALNQTLSRTIITSGTVFLATLSLYLFGGGVINDFAFTFLVGIITGTYSSIYIAGAIVLWWNKGQRPKLGAQVGGNIEYVDNVPVKA
jgi:SecD/SecF fusion protein